MSFLLVELHWRVWPMARALLRERYEMFKKLNTIYVDGFHEFYQHTEQERRENATA
jgi:hypothetical protein